MQPVGDYTNRDYSALVESLLAGIARARELIDAVGLGDFVGTFDQRPHLGGRIAPVGPGLRRRRRYDRGHSGSTTSAPIGVPYRSRDRCKCC